MIAAHPREVEKRSPPVRRTILFIIVLSVIVWLTVLLIDIIGFLAG